MKLYMAERSGNAYKARLLLSLLDIPYEYAAIGAWVTRIQARPGYVPLPSLGKS